MFHFPAVGARPVRPVFRLKSTNVSSMFCCGKPERGKWWKNGTTFMKV